MNNSYTFWSIWRTLSALSHLVILVLGGVSIYTIYSAVTTLLRIRAIKAQNSHEDVTTLRHRLAALERCCTNLRQMTMAVFYLFAIAFFGSLRSAYFTPDSQTPVGTLILQNFFLEFSFGTNVFFVFFILHMIQWFMWRRLNALQTVYQTST